MTFSNRNNPGEDAVVETDRKGSQNKIVHVQRPETDKMQQQDRIITADINNNSVQLNNGKFKRTLVMLFLQPSVRWYHQLAKYFSYYYCYTYYLLANATLSFTDTFFQHHSIIFIYDMADFFKDHNGNKFRTLLHHSQYIVDLIYCRSKSQKCSASQQTLLAFACQLECFSYTTLCSGTTLCCTQYICSVLINCRHVAL